MKISEKAKEYAEGKALNAITTAIETAYADGYNAGYNDALASKEDELPEDLVRNVEYVDLGLPSGTKWAADYLKDKNGGIVYLPYDEAAKLNIPTKEQYEELLKYCKLESIIDGQSRNNTVIGYSIVGRNSKTVHYKRDIIYRAENLFYCSIPRFWLLSESQDDLYRINAAVGGRKSYGLQFMGYKFPVILVR